LKTRISCWSICLLGCVTSLYAQDSLSTYQRVVIQQQTEQTFKKEYYYNPANRLGYSNFTFSDLLLIYNKKKDKLYKLQDGYGVEGIQIDASSYKIVNATTRIWGTATYKKETYKGLQWNTNLDSDILGPYVVADSTSGSMKNEVYAFSGGYVKQIHAFTLGIEAQYQANLGYKVRDPRPKNISSDMTIKGGLGYTLTEEWKISAYGLFNKYTQNSEIKFANETQKAALYQMNGLGTWSRYFSGKSNGANYERPKYEYGANVENNRHHFIVGFTKGNSKLKRFIKGVGIKNSSGDAEGNRLEESYYSLYAIKSFAIDNGQIDVKYKYDHQEKNGIEVYYTDNEAKGLVKLLEKKLYKYTDNSHAIEGRYEYNFAKSQWVIRPFWKYQETTELLKEVNSKQHFTYQYLGLHLDYTKTLTASSILVISPTLTYRKVSQTTNQLNLDTTKPAIQDWLLNDYTYLSIDYMQWGGTVKYALEKLKNAPMFIAITFNQVDFKTKKRNNYLGVALGVTF